MGSIKVVLTITILVALAYTLETDSYPIVDNQDLAIAGNPILESVVPDLDVAEKKWKKYKKGHGHGGGHGGGGGGGSSEERR